MVLSLLASGGPNDAPPFFILLTVVFMGIIAIALILAHFRQSLLAGYFICGVILANCGIPVSYTHLTLPTICSV